MSVSGVGPSIKPKPIGISKFKSFNASCLTTLLAFLSSGLRDKISFVPPIKLVPKNPCSKASNTGLPCSNAL
jgi:hypothetical protein